MTETSKIAIKSLKIIIYIFNDITCKFTWLGYVYIETVAGIKMHPNLFYSFSQRENSFQTTACLKQRSHEEAHTLCNCMEPD